MEEFKGAKMQRVLSIYTKLLNGERVNKAEEALHYGVNERTIQRDIEDIRDYFDEESHEKGYLNDVIYDPEIKGYRLEQIYSMKLSNAEILAIAKVLLASRAFTKEDISDMLKRLIDNCTPRDSQQAVLELINNELFHYVEPRHHMHCLDMIWDLGQAIRNHQYIEISYQRTVDKKCVTRKLKPLAIMFSEYYFYLTAFIDDKEVTKDFDVLNDAFPTIYRIDRIKDLKVLNDHYRIPYKDKFEEGEFRKRIQFMYGGKLQTVKFVYSGLDIDAVLDRLPTAKVLNKDHEKYTVSAEVFGSGINMWLRSQGNMIHVLNESRCC